MGFQSNKMNNSRESVRFKSLLDSDQQSQERLESWFAGTLIRINKNEIANDKRYFFRLANYHNQITQEETGFDQRFKANNTIALRLAEFYPLKWLNEISNAFRDTKTNKIGLRYGEDRIYAYLAYIDLLLIFRGMTILDSTLAEISRSLGVTLTRNKLRTYRLKLLRIYPALKQKWLTLRAQIPAKILLATVIHIMNNELAYPTCSHKEIFQIKHKALEYGQRLSNMERVKRMKSYEMWCRAICLKAFRDVFPHCSTEIFPSLTPSTFAVVENKRWQLDKLLISI